jgi:glycosyltransferase involved in cell wall biosynthesis
VFALVEALADDFRFSVITSALDDPAAAPMDSVKPSQWSTFGNAMIWYELRHRIPARKVIALIRETKPQLVYLNSIFDYRFATLPLLVTRMISRRITVVLAPRGELSAGALTLKRNKKRFFVMIFRILGLHKAVSWHASTSQEKADIERAFGASVRSHIAIDLRTGISCGSESPNRGRLTHSEPNSCSMVFFSRIVPKKNLATLIKAMRLVQGNVHLSIAGPIEDGKYWAKCLALIDDIGDRESVTYIGTIPPDDVTGFLSRFDLFVLPTLGENFGHVVLESLAAGTPVIVGRDTPWQQIETVDAGWMCDPASPEEVAGLIQRFLALDESARLRMRIAARNVATEVLNDPHGVNANRAMFRALICDEQE